MGGFFLFLYNLLGENEDKGENYAGTRRSHPRITKKKLSFVCLMMAGIFLIVLALLLFVKKKLKFLLRLPDVELEKRTFFAGE